MKKLISKITGESILWTSGIGISFCIMCIVISINSSASDNIPVGISTQVIDRCEIICCKTGAGVTTMLHKPTCKNCQITYH